MPYAKEKRNVQIFFDVSSLLGKREGHIPIISHWWVYVPSEQQLLTNRCCVEPTPKTFHEQPSSLPYNPMNYDPVPRVVPGPCTDWTFFFIVNIFTYIPTVIVCDTKIVWYPYADIAEEKRIETTFGPQFEGMRAYDLMVFTYLPTRGRRWHEVVFNVGSLYGYLHASDTTLHSWKRFRKMFGNRNILEKWRKLYYTLIPNRITTIVVLNAPSTLNTTTVAGYNKRSF